MQTWRVCNCSLSFILTWYNWTILNRLQLPFMQHRTKQEDQKENVDHCWSTSTPSSPCRFLVPFFFVDNILSGFHFKEEARGRLGIRPKTFGPKIFVALEICLADLGREHGLTLEVSKLRFHQRFCQSQVCFLAGVYARCPEGNQNNQCFLVILVWGIIQLTVSSETTPIYSWCW